MTNGKKIARSLSGEPDMLCSIVYAIQRLILNREDLTGESRLGACLEFLLRSNRECDEIASLWSSEDDKLGPALGILHEDATSSKELVDAFFILYPVSISSTFQECRLKYFPFLRK